MTFNEYVANILTEKAKDYDSGEVSSVVEDLMENGCQSGMISDLVYYSQTVPVFIRFQNELNEILTAILNETRLSPQSFLKERGWDDNDPLILGDVNRNLIVWLAFEWVASQIAEDED